MRAPGPPLLVLMDALYLLALLPMHASWLRTLPLARHQLHQALRSKRLTS